MKSLRLLLTSFWLGHRGTDRPCGSSRVVISPFTGNHEMIRSSSIQRSRLRSGRVRRVPVPV
ncbi:MAG: hypothetical protein LH702_19410, partial [Phormidesmis sp. CAN_BIN44]|nr:hypothetical protein [Phormidesmis sp. CAN_BIN44]